MSEYPEPQQATDSTTLEQRIMDCRLPKSEHEWWAKHEIEALRQQLAESRARVAELEGVIPDQILTAHKQGEVCWGAFEKLELAVKSPIVRRFILRAQADAVEAWANDQHLPPDEDLTEVGWHAKRIYERAKDYAQRLREQAKQQESGR